MPILVTLICLVAIRPAGAQSFYGTIVGVVTDASGAVVPGATVKATQTETNETRSGATNDAGVYTLSTVPAGTYVVSFSKSGFDLFEARGIDRVESHGGRLWATRNDGPGTTFHFTLPSTAAELEAPATGT